MSILKLDIGERADYKTKTQKKAKEHYSQTLPPRKYTFVVSLKMI